VFEYIAEGLKKDGKDVFKWECYRRKINELNAAADEPTDFARHSDLAALDQRMMEKFNTMQDRIFDLEVQLAALQP
jgi:hypothetical protein